MAIFNRMWPLAVVAVAAGVLGFFFPQVPAMAAGYALLVALLWRKQSRGRGGDRGARRRGVLARPQLAVRAASAACALPGMRKIEPDDAGAERAVTGA